MKKPLLVLLLYVSSVSSFSQSNIDAGPLNEVFRQTNLRIGTAAPTPRLWDPWEITYGPDDSLWVTEAKAYKVSKISPVTGQGRTILDISQGSAFTPAIFRAQFNIATNNPQGGLMGLAIHPEFMTNPAKKFVYLAYVYSFTGALADSQGVIYVNRVVRFTYNGNQLVNPVSLCDTLPGSNDHNSGRMIIAPVGGVDYLFYAQGDMGAGQFLNQYRLEKAQMIGSYEGKILRFNLESDGDPGPSLLDQWIPNNNPYNATLGVQSAVWAMGIRNNQGFAYATINGVGRLYGASHGPFSDDEINIIDSAKNYGHPLVIGLASDNNYNSSRAGLRPRVSPPPPNSNQLPLIANETNNATTIGAKYRDPIVSFYPGAQATINGIYLTNTPGNISWPSEAPSGIDIYTNSMIPGWKNSLIIGSLKGGRIIRMNLNSTGTGTAPNDNFNDTNTLFRSVNRFRDIAISPDGKSIFTVIDSSATTSGPTTANPIISACRGCVQKYTFLGYNFSGSAFPAASFTSTIPASITIAAGTANQCEDANDVVINSANNNTNIWVPITDTNSNIIAEIYANGHDLDTVRTSFYRNSGAIRKDGGNRYYADRNITITPQTQPGANIAIRLYITNAEFNSLNSAPASGIGGLIANVGIFKNSNNVCGPILSGGPASAVTTITKAAFGAGGYVLQSNALPSFSTFYFANASITTLPVQMVSFTGNLSNNATLLNWTTSTEVSTANFEIERSIDGNSYSKIGTVTASGNSSVPLDYSYTDNGVITLSASVIYYRLKIVDRDGHYDYSNIVTISLADVAGRVTIFPNPAADKANVTIGATADGNVQWKILDNAGRTVLQNNVDVRKGRNNIVINIDKLSAGIYYLSVSGGGVDQKVKLQKL